MEKRCGFCMELSPIVYCEADAAYLCLSCDAKVHSANALSFRHPRTLLCESCRCGPAIVRCSDHRMFLCRTCDHTIHHHHQNHLQEHKKVVITCYVGCPSAKDLASLWGFDFDELTDTQGTKQESSFLIVQQILCLERLQHSEGVDGSCLLHVNDGLPLSRHDIMSKVHKNVDNSNEHFDGNLDFQKSENRLEEKMHHEHLSSPFSQIESGNPLHGDSFWQYKSPANNNEIWLQNMQDLGVCDEVRCFDDVIIPDVDFTFRNFEELFGNEHEANRVVHDDNKDMQCSSADKHRSFGKLDRAYSSTFEDIEKEIDGYDQAHQLETINYSPYSAFSGDSGVFEYRDDGLYPPFHDHLLQHGSYNSEKTKLDGKKGTFTMRNKEKKVLRQEKQGHYTSPKSKSDFKKRGKGQVFEDHRWQ